MCPFLFFDFPYNFLAMPGPDLGKTGSDPNLVVGEIRHVSESTSFSSQTGPQEPNRAPGDPPEPSQEGFKK